ncbi:Rha family transcriptional regulator [Acinetobacter bereziniae]|uniref:Rha family transcriptional regulator n=1 Tax=Acinetobacter bereziniae TaxID=106648 RepID=UPI003AF4CCB2
MNTLIQMDDAVFIQDDQVKTTSLKIAEIFKKRHDHVLRKIENILTMKSTAPNFEVSEFTEHNFQLSEYLDGTGRKLPMYEMTKDGFIFLVMGFTGEDAALTKIAYINTFNQMAAMLYNTQGHHEHIHVGAKVQLKAGGPIYTVSRIHYDTNGLMQDAEVMWHDRSAKLCREIIPVACLTLDTKNLIQNKTLDDFWRSVEDYGLSKLNHSRSDQILALNMTQIYQCIQGLPPKVQLSAVLMQSQNPHPIYMQHNYAVSSVLTKKTQRCWIFSLKRQSVNLLN